MRLDLTQEGRALISRFGVAVDSFNCYLRNDLIDELRLKIHPLTLGKGKHFFDEGPIPAAFELTERTITSKGVIIVHYKRAGKVKTGKVGA